MKKKIRKAVKECLLELKDCNYDWCAKFKLCDNESLTYRLFVPNSYTNEPLRIYGESENAVVFTEYTIGKGSTIKYWVDEIYSDYLKLIKDY